jgi:uncharacterized protein YkwD
MSGCETSDLQNSSLGANNPSAQGPDQYQQQLLDLINDSRATAGLPPYVFSAVESNGTTTCVGSLGHSIDMAKKGGISHDQFPADICTSFVAAGENVGYSFGVSESDGIAQIHQSMMNEGPSGGHYQNIMSSRFTTVGIGLYVDSGGVLWLTEDFTEQ